MKSSLEPEAHRLRAPRDFEGEQDFSSLTRRFEQRNRKDEDGLNEKHHQPITSALV